MNTNQIIGQRIKQLREESGMFQKDIYEQLDMKKSTYSDIETGSVSIPIETLYKIADVLKQPIQKLLGIKDNNVQYISDNTNILVSQNHNGNLIIQITKEMLDSLKENKLD
jgi:transcriptional regulator with XRE-family HTH domain